MTASLRYQVPGWPAAIQGHAAVVPHFNRHAASGAQQYKDGVTGQPGTQTIPVDVTVTPGYSQLAGQALMGLGRAQDAGNWFLPNLYYAKPERDFWPGAGMPVAVRSDNLMPVPAADPRGIPATLYQPIVQRGHGQIQARPNLPRWAAINAT